MNLKKLSEKLGLSQTTVSRALNGYPEVNEKTRIRVQEAAKRFNYSPNSRAKGLATGRSMVIGHVIPSAKKHEMVNPIFGDFVAGASDALAHFGYGMMFTRVEADAEEDAYRNMMSNSSVDGVILQGPSVNDARIAMLQRIGMPFVVHGRSSGVTTPYSWVDVNNTRAFKRATQFLTQLGHMRIALLNGREDMDFAVRRREGYIAALEDAGLSVDETLMRSAEMTEGYGHQAMTEMLAAPNPPTAVLAASMISAIGVRRAIEEAGLRMGRDISVVTHDDDLSYLGNGQGAPIFTATRSSVREAGELVAEFLIDQIQNPDSGEKTHLLEAELLVGDSTGPARKGI